MLVLKRAINEQIVIDLPPVGAELDKLAGTRITVMVVDCGRGWARLGFTAPRSVEIVRTELLTENTR